VDKNRSTGGTLLPTRRAHGSGHIGVARAGSKLTEVTAAVVEFLIEGEWLKPAEATPSVRSPRRSVANSASKAMIARQPEGWVQST